ncbi:hypothetical protein ABQ433_05015 [Citrobacter freundii]|uniref:hypothetical protein n=1 Tax=Citrobacter freundii TaxID=546 RepID=UPI003AAF1637
MTALNKQALIAKIKKQTKSFDTVVLKEDEANLLLGELESQQIFQQAFFRQSLMYDVVAEAYEEAKEQIANDVGIKARLCLESNSLFDRLRAAEKRIAELEGELEVSQHDLSDTEDAMHIWAERACKAESCIVDSHEPAAYAPSGHLERYLNCENSGCWVYGSKQNDSDDPLYRGFPALSVELPTGTGWSSDPYNHGRNDGISECIKALRAAGIGVKGE